MRHRLITIALAGALASALGASAPADDAQTIDALLEKVARISADLPPVSEIEQNLSRASDLLRAKRYKESLTILQDIVRKNPEDLSARFLAASALVGLHRYEEARKLMALLLELHPLHAGVLNNLAWMYATATDPAYRRPEEALALARRAVVIDPVNFHIWSTLSEAYFINREFSRALRAAEEALRMAKEQNVDTRQIIIYEKQVAKCREAVAAYSIFE